MSLKILKTLIGILLMPVAIGTAKAFYLIISGISGSSGALHLLERGILVYLLFHVLVMRPAYLYVLGHEFVHVLATWICGGKVVAFNVSPGGGSAVTSKTNFFIELSPYFIPIYTILLGLIYVIFDATGRGTAFPTGVFIFLVGATLAFHFIMTTEVIKMQQPDIDRSGLIFSLVVIFVSNLIITMAVFCPIIEELSFVSFIKDMVSKSIGVYQVAYGKVMGFVKAAGI